MFCVRDPISSVQMSVDAFAIASHDRRARTKIFSLDICFVAKANARVAARGRPVAVLTSIHEYKHEKVNYLQEWSLP